MCDFCKNKILLQQKEERETHILDCSSPMGKRIKVIDAVSLITQLWLFCALQNMGLLFT